MTAETDPLATISRETRARLFANRVSTVAELHDLNGQPSRSILENIPPVEEVIRINGRATISRDEAFLADMVIQNRTPVMGVVVEVDEVYGRCSRALQRSKVFSPETWTDPNHVPTCRAISAEQNGQDPPQNTDHQGNDMTKLRALAVATAKELWSLLVDDGFLAIAALAAIGVAYGLSRDGALGPANLVGWALTAMIVTAMTISVRRAIAAKTRTD